MPCAYEAVPILEKLPLQIQIGSIACYEDVLLVGTKQGHLLQYKISKDKDQENKFNIQLEGSNKSFAKKPITQLSAITDEEYILVSLSDNVISVHDLSTFGLLTIMSRTKGATLFAVDEKNCDSNKKHLRLCVAVKKKIQLYYWRNREFKEIQADLSLYDTPRAMSWCNDSIFVGFKREYFLIKVNDGNLKELFSLGGKRSEPLVAKLSDNQITLGRNEMSIFIDEEGSPSQKYPLQWTDIPIALVHDPPYIIAVLPKYVEVRTIQPRLMIQSIELAKPLYICVGSGLVYVASNNHCWRLTKAPISEQVNDLVKIKEFELALRLVSENMESESEAEKQKRLQKIQNRQAFHLFCQHQFDASMKLFMELDTDPSHVIGLYPNLLPSCYHKDLTYPDTVPELDGGDLENALLALIDYLNAKRYHIMKIPSKEITTTAIGDMNRTIKSKRQIAQIIDTTLLKCYLETNDALMAPFLRRNDNQCHIEESERVLRSKEKFSELIILYRKKELHQKALSLLMQQACRPSSSLHSGQEGIVEYLQHLGPSHIDLIFEYSAGVLQKDPTEGLSIFTEDMPEVESLPRDKVLEFLETNFRSTVTILYLEHIIEHWKDTNTDFHNLLVNLYRGKIQELMSIKISSNSDSQEYITSTVELKEFKAKLISFLEKSQYYTPERLLSYFPLDDFYEERAILLGRLGRHEQALAIYVHILNNHNLAEQYCINHYDSTKEGNKDVYLHLLKMYLQPPNPANLGIMVKDISEVKVQIDPALYILDKHAVKIDASKALELLPPTTKIKDILNYLENLVEKKAALRRNHMVLRNVMSAENVMVIKEHMKFSKIKCVITEEKNCRVCKKRIGNSAFARYPNGVIVHYHCCNDVKVCPTEQR
ncbi:vam6/Vps39-like protein [Argonauta hians]